MMRPSMLLALLAGLALGPCASAQQPTASPLVLSEREPSEVMLLRLNATSRCQQACVIRNAPYSAERVTETVQVLADGNRIVDRRVELLYRDSEGRTRIESEWLNKRIIQIQDPVGKMSYRLYPADKSGIMMAISEPAAAPAPAPALLPQVGTGVVASPGAAKMAETLAPVLAAANSAQDNHHSSRPLPSRHMEGLLVEGSLQSTTIPAGKVGNAMPLVSTIESWNSRELRLLVYSKSKDPRTGERTARLQNIRREEPPAALFAAPSDYNVQEIVRTR